MFSILSDNVSTTDLKNLVENSRQTRPFEIVQYAKLTNLVIEPGYKGITILRDSYFFPQFNINPLQAGDRILLYGQNDSIENGVWNVMSVFAGYVNIQRPPDYAKNTPIRSGQCVLSFSMESVFSGYITASNTILTVSGTVSGHPIVLGMILSGTNIKEGTKITAYGTGSGGSGTYTISDAPTINIGTIGTPATILGLVNNYKNSAIFKNTTPEYDSNQNKIISYNGSSQQSWQFYRYIYAPFPLSESPFTVRNGAIQYFTQTSFKALTNNNLSFPSVLSEYKLHPSATIAWGFIHNLTGGSVQVWWSNNDGANPQWADLARLYINVGSWSYGTGLTTITYTSPTIVPPWYPYETYYTPLNIIIPSNITWNYLEIKAASPPPGYDHPKYPVVWEVRINNIPNTF